MALSHPGPPLSLSGRGSCDAETRSEQPSRAVRRIPCRYYRRRGGGWRVRNSGVLSSVLKLREWHAEHVPTIFILEIGGNERAPAGLKSFVDCRESAATPRTREIYAYDLCPRCTKCEHFSHLRNICTVLLTLEGDPPPPPHCGLTAAGVWQRRHGYTTAGTSTTSGATSSTQRRQQLCAISCSYVAAVSALTAALVPDAAAGGILSVLA